MPVRQVEAHITVTPTVVAIKQAEGWLGPATFQSHGEVTMVEGKAYSNMTLAMSMDASELQSWWAEQAEHAFIPEMEGTHLAPCSRVTGVVGHPTIKGRMDLGRPGSVRSIGSPSHRRLPPRSILKGTFSATTG
ncbi:MAG: hypothetical protein KF848_09230 [Nitrospira sp.]|nr:hypothetical protein [Nitrospira sp.]